MQKTALLLMFFGGFVLSCTNQESNDELEASTTEESVFEKDEDLEGLKLNLGKKWKVNHETAIGIANIDNLLSSFEGDDYKLLGIEIKDELSQIIKLCTMKGEDHDQFHIVLHAMMKESKKLKKGKSASTDKMKRYLEVYYAHFEE